MAPDPEGLKSAPWYHEKLTKVDPKLQSLLERRGVPKSEVIKHIEAIRDKAWPLFPYPCIGMFSFTHRKMESHPLYKTVLARLLPPSSETLIDLGCGFAQDLRGLVWEGVDSSHLAGLDNHDGFINLSYELFRDKEMLKTRFVVGDMLELSSVPEEMRGSFDMVWAGASFHLFGWEKQVRASIVAVKLLKDKVGSMIFGYSVGHDKGQERQNPNLDSGLMFMHDPDTFVKLWTVVGEETATRWRVSSWMDVRGIDDLRKRDPAMRRQVFAVKRIAGESGVEIGESKRAGL